ncbi:MAG TPA: hypothetical protein VFA43_01975 [Gemmatimonadaceae bacterium]|nr:hypothetical protein [Gemmatimonadaceae bacterium]
MNRRARDVDMRVFTRARKGLFVHAALYVIVNALFLLDWRASSP